MTRPSKSSHDYVSLAASKGLRFIGGTPPEKTTRQTRWQCIYCGTVLTKSYQSVKTGEHGCSCQNDMTVKPDKYYELAAFLGIQWVGMTASRLIPRNTKVKTVWQGRDGRIVEASYSELAYGRLSHNLRTALGIPDGEVIAAFVRASADDDDEDEDTQPAAPIDVDAFG